jgi:hypothetical protein
MSLRTKKKRIFTRKNYTSNDGMMTSIWGPSMWHYLHTMSFNYPENPTHDDKIHYMKFVKLLEKVLPCGKCRKNLRQNMKSLPITMDTMESRRTFSTYIYKLHEVINKMLGKKSGLSYCDVRDRYEMFRSRCSKKEDIDTSEKGCIDPLKGRKSKCILKIVPQTYKCETLKII